MNICIFLVLTLFSTLVTSQTGAELNSLGEDCFLGGGDTCAGSLVCLPNGGLLTYPISNEGRCYDTPCGFNYGCEQEDDQCLCKYSTDCPLPQSFSFSTLEECQQNLTKEDNATDLDCSLENCMVPECNDLEELSFIPGVCCPLCLPDLEIRNGTSNSNCTDEICIMPDCDEFSFLSYVPDECCPVCLPGIQIDPPHPLPTSCLQEGYYTDPQDSCLECLCSNGRESCIDISYRCPPSSCADPVYVPGKCCPVCPIIDPPAPPPSQCEQEGEFTDPQNPCLECFCSRGRKSCVDVSNHCPPANCDNPTYSPDECCPLCPAIVEPSSLPDSAFVDSCDQTTCPPTNCPEPIVVPGICCPICAPNSNNCKNGNCSVDSPPDEPLPCEEGRDPTNPCNRCICDRNGQHQCLFDERLCPESDNRDRTVRTAPTPSTEPISSSTTSDLSSHISTTTTPPGAAVSTHSSSRIFRITVLLSMPMSTYNSMEHEMTERVKTILIRVKLMYRSIQIFAYSKIQTEMIVEAESEGDEDTVSEEVIQNMLVKSLNAAALVSGEATQPSLDSTTSKGSRLTEKDRDYTFVIITTSVAGSVAVALFLVAAAVVLLLRRNKMRKHKLQQTSTKTVPLDA